MNIVAGFLLFLIILFFIVKCVLSYIEDNRAIRSIKGKEKTGPETEPTTIELPNINSQ